MRLLSLACCILLSTLAASAAPFRVVGYVPTWSINTVQPESLAKLTDVIIFSAEVDPSGVFPETPITADALAWYQQAKATHGLRLHLCFGGWGRSDGFAAMATDPTKRAAFIAAVVDYCAKNGITGIDYDWEFPEDTAQKTAYDDLLVETKVAAAAKALEVSVALGFTQHLSERAYTAVDHVHLMTYDMGKRHATFDAMEGVVKRLLRKGLPAAKICLGVPFYGRKMDDLEASLGYASIVEQHRPEPKADEAGGYYYNGPDTLRAKTRYALEQQLAGIMIWEITTDTKGETSLLHAIADEAAKPR
jgi:chitinase